MDKPTLHKAGNGWWFYSVKDAIGLLNVGYFQSKQEAAAAAKNHRPAQLLGARVNPQANSSSP